MQPIEYAKKAKKLVPELSAFIIEQKFRINSQGYFISVIYMWLHYKDTAIYGHGPTRAEAWEELEESVKKEFPNANR